jgi:hypothetical protein
LLEVSLVPFGPLLAVFAEIRDPRRPWANGIPSHNTFRRVFVLIDPD